MHIKNIVFLITVITTTLICCSCKSNISSNSNEDEPMTTETFSVEINKLVPETVTLDDIIEGADSLRNSVNDSYSIMLELAADKNASTEAVEAANNITSEYKSYIDDLAKLDFASMNQEEIDSYMAEMSELITKIREVRDLLSQ